MYKVITVLLIAITFNAVGQLDPQKLKYAKKAERFRKMRSIGITMIGAGAGMFVYGVYKLSHSSYNNGGYNQTNSNTDATYALMVVGGVYLVGGGIPLTIIGARKTRQYENKLQVASLKLGLSNQMPGLSLTLKFK